MFFSKVIAKKCNELAKIVVSLSMNTCNQANYYC